MIDSSLPYAESLLRREKALATACVHAADAEENEGLFGRALETPVVLSSAFGFENADHAAAAFRGESDAYIYGRWGNPTTEALERALAALEGAEAACATASGMAAISGTLLSLLEAGDHVVAPRALYAESARLFRERLPKLGITTTFVDGAEPAGSFGATVELLEPIGSDTFVELQAGDATVVARVAPDVKLEISQVVHAAFAPGRVHLFDRETGGRIIR